MPIGSGVRSVFEQSAGALLILGAPGAGKTTLMLELASVLLDEAEHDVYRPIPVLLNLSSWSAERRNLTLWLINELSRLFGVSHLLAERWIEDDQISPLLDGLDEVNLKFRESCVVHLNEFRSRHGLLPIVISCRSSDYHVLSTRLRLPIAINIGPLSRGQVDNYLRRVGEPLERLHEAVAKDESLAELFSTPVMLSIASVALRGKSSPNLLTTSIEERRQLVLAQYVETMLRRSGARAPYPRDQLLRWLGWLSIGMGQSALQLEDIGPAWLPDHHSKKLIGFGIRITAALLGACITGVMGASIDQLTGRLPTFTIFGVLMGGVVGGCSRQLCKDNAHPVDTLQLSGTALIRAVVATMNSLSILKKPGEMGHAFEEKIDEAFISGEISIRTLPGEGVRRSLRNAAAALLLSILVVMPFQLVVLWLFSLHSGSVLAFVIMAIFFIRSLWVPVLMTLKKGGMFCIQHYLTRALLAMKGLAPWRHVRFLDYAAQCVFLQKVGGGYIFVHRLLMEHFSQTYRSRETASGNYAVSNDPLPMGYVPCDICAEPILPTAKSCCVCGANTTAKWIPEFGRYQLWAIFSRKRIKLAAVASAAVALTATWNVFRPWTNRWLTSEPHLEIVNSSEDIVLPSLLSPDGGYMAYGDGSGIHLHRIGSRETWSIPRPISFSAEDIWWPVDWFPDGNHLLVESRQQQPKGSGQRC